MTTQIVQDFLNTRNAKLVILSEIEKLQAQLLLNKELENNTEVERLGTLLDETFERLYINQESFEAKYEISYNDTESNYLVDGIFPQDENQIEKNSFTRSDRFAIASAKNNIKTIKEKGFVSVAQPEKIANKILKYTGVRVVIDGNHLSFN